MTKTLFDLRTELVQLFEQGEWDAALKRCIVILQGAPGNFEARMKVGDILLKQGMLAQAQDVYKVVAWHFIKAGFPLLGIVGSKMLTAVDESYQDVLEVLASLYSSESDRVDAEAHSPELPDLETVPVTEAGENVDQVIPLKGKELAVLATELAKDEKGLDEYPEKLCAIPIFSDLGEEAFGQLLANLKLRRFARGATIIQEGQVGSSFFLLARGVVEISKQVEGKELRLAELMDGSVFGEMALFSKNPRSATVRAMTHVDLLELSREDLEREAHQYKSVAKALYRFTRARMLDNMMIRSVVFRQLPQVERMALLEKFISMDVRKGQLLIEEGKKGIGLFVILHGDAEVKKREDGKLIPLALLREGDVFGEISLVRDIPTTATVIAGRDGEYLFLSRQEFEKQVSLNPSLWRALTEISEERLCETTSRMKETDFLGDEEFVLL